MIIIIIINCDKAEEQVLSPLLLTPCKMCGKGKMKGQERPARVPH